MSAATIAVMILAMLVFAAPSEASSCIDGDEARQLQSSVDIDRHGQAHCADAIPAGEYHQVDFAREAAPSVIERKTEPAVAPGVVLAAIALEPAIHWRWRELRGSAPQLSRFLRALACLPLPSCSSASWLRSN